MKITREELLEELNRIRRYQAGTEISPVKYRDEETDHVDADNLLLNYIADCEISEAFDDIYKWYA